MLEHPPENDEKRALNQESSEESEEEGIPFFPNHWLKEVIAVYLMLGILISLAVLLPFKLHGEADPLSTPEGIKPEWYFLWVYQALKYFPKKILFIEGKTVGVILIFGVVGFMQFVWPILDNQPERHPRHRKFTMGFVAATLFVGILLMVLGVLSEQTVHIAGKTYHFNLYGIPEEVTPAETGGPEAQLPDQGASPLRTPTAETSSEAAVSDAGGRR